MTDLKDSVAHEIRIRQSMLVIRMIPILIAGNLAGIGVIAQLDWDRFVTSYAIWPAIVFIVLLIPLALNWFQFRTKPRPESVSKRRIRRIGLHSLLMGLAWAAIVGFFVPAVGETEKIAILTVSGFLWYGAIAILGGVPQATGAYIPPFWSAYYIMVMVTGTDFPYTISACAGVALAAVFLTGRQNWIDFKSTVALEMEQARITRENLEAEAARQAEVAGAQRRMIEAIPFPLVLTLKDGILPVGQQATKIFKIDSQQLTDRKVEDFFVDPQDQKEMFSRLAKDGRYDGFEVQMQDTEGNRFWVLASGRPLEYEGEDCFLNSIISIDDRKRAEAELLQATETVREQNEMLETVATQLGKYMSPQLYQAIFSGQQKVEIESRRKKLTVFFSDIAGFTETTEQLESEELTALLNQYLTEMSKIAREFGATVDKFIGDAIVLYFGDPDSTGVKEDAAACVRMAIAMQKRMRELNNQWRDLGLERTFELRIGINTGYCTVGNFGSEDRMDYTIIGSEVNLAARLEGASDIGGILLANETYSLVKDWIDSEEKEAITVKGFPRPIRTFQVKGILDEVSSKQQIIERNIEGISLTIDPNRVSRMDAIKELEDALAQLKE